MSKTVRKILVLLFAISLQTFAQAQEMTITGIVNDDTGASLPGVSVVVKGTTIGTSTNIDGAYEIKAAKGSVLVYSFVGFQVHEIAVADNIIMNIVLNVE